MKNFFKKYDLMKILFFVILFVTILTWFIPSGSFSGTEFVDKGLARIGIFDFFLTHFYAIYYFVLQILFIVVVGGFYGVLSKTKGYSALVNRISKTIKGRETIFIVIVSLLLAVFTSINNEILIGVLFVPFITSILAKNGVDKFKIFASTFGAILVGLLGATFSTFGYSYINTSFGLKVTDAIGWKILVFVIAYILLMVFTFMKKKSKKEIQLYEDKFNVLETKKGVKVWPIVTVLSIVAILAIMGYIPWGASFNISFFTEINDKIMNFQIGETPIFSYLFNGFNAFGSWDLFNLIFILLIASFIINCISKNTVTDYIDNFIDGVKSVAKEIVVYILIQCVFIISYWTSISSAVTNKLIPVGSEFNLFMLILVALFASIVNIDHGFTGYTIGGYLASVYSSQALPTVFVLNTVFGFTQLIAPTSVLLFVGLSYLDISYKDYIKNMWKYLLGLLFFIVLVQVIFIYM